MSEYYAAFIVTCSARSIGSHLEVARGEWSIIVFGGDLRWGKTNDHGEQN